MLNRIPLGDIIFFISSNQMSPRSQHADTPPLSELIFALFDYFRHKIPRFDAIFQVAMPKTMPQPHSRLILPPFFEKTILLSYQ
jgi:hypothetical protein